MENFGNVETPLYATRLPDNLSLSSLAPSLNAPHNHVFDFFFKLFAVSFSLNSSLPSEREDNTIKQNSLLRYHSQRNRMNWSGTFTFVEFYQEDLMRAHQFRAHQQKQSQSLINFGSSQVCLGVRFTDPDSSCSAQLYQLESCVEINMNMACRSLSSDYQ